MGYEASNIGKARLQVNLVEKSPFNGVPKQEYGNYFTLDNIESLEGLDDEGQPDMKRSPKNVYALPHGIDGIRLSEKMYNYPNFLEDFKKNLLEDSTISTSPIQYYDNSSRTIASNYVNDFLERRVKEGKEPITQTSLTWSINNNIYGQAGLPFSQVLSSGDTSQARWIYKIKTQPGADNFPTILCPFMSQANQKSDTAIHWGVKKSQNIAYGMPFEVLYYHENEEFSVAQNGPDLDPDGKFDVEEFRKLANKAYFIIEIGIETPEHNYIFLFVNGDFPRVFKVENGKAVFKYKFEFMNGDALFTKNNKYFSVKFEPAKWGILVRISSEQFSVPWVIAGTQKDPILITTSTMALYGGNIQAGFNWRPIQYVDFGSFAMPEVVLNQYYEYKGDNPTVTSAVKGIDTKEQNVSYDEETGRAVLFACDAEEEESFGQAEASKFTVKTPFSPSDDSPTWTPRKIQLYTYKTIDPNESEKTTGSIVIQRYKTVVTMTPGNITDGLTEWVNCKSPTIWQVRHELEQIDFGGDINEAEDISCDVLSCETSWNSTSTNEISHTATLKVLSRGRDSNSVTLYESLMNRCVYFRIRAWWDNGGGHDPGSDDGRIVFTGYSTSVTKERVRDKEVFTFKLEDFMHALEGSKFILSPYYDGMKAHLAVADIAKRLGIGSEHMFFGDGEQLDDTSRKDPLDFGLPFSNPFEEPQFHFKDGTSLKAGILKIAQTDGKCIYFDEKGDFHYSPIPGDIVGDDTNAIVASFFTYQDQAESPANVCWNAYTSGQTPGDVYNSIHIATVIKETGNLYHVAWANGASVNDPGSDGYVGYRKYLIIKDPAIASQEAAQKALQTYLGIVTTPPITGHFETYGYTGLKPMDVVQVNGESFRIVNIASTFDAKENQYWMSVDGEWFGGGNIKV